MRTLETLRHLATGVLLLVASATQGAVITVDTLDDSLDENDGNCALREAIYNAVNNNGSYDCVAGDGSDSIGFDAALFSGSPPSATIMLDPLRGQLSVSGDSLTIATPAGTTLVLASSGTHRVMHASQTAGAMLQIEGLEFRGGRDSTGGGLALFSQFATLERVRFVDNQSSVFASGGALHWASGEDAGTLVLRDCSFEDNSAGSFGGGLYAILNGDLDIEIEDCGFLDNTSTYDGGAVSVDVNEIATAGTPEVLFRRVRFERNGGSYGGALQMRANALASRVMLTIEASLFRSNSTEFDGAALYIEGNDLGSGVVAELLRSSFISNTAAVGQTGNRIGGAVYLSAVGLRAENNLFVRNETNSASAALVLRNTQKVIPQQVALIGNSFYENRLRDASGPRTLELAFPAEASTWDVVVRGNAFTPGDTPVPSQGECRIYNNNADLPLSAGANVSADASCAFAAGDLVADPLLALVTTGDPLRPRTAYPAAGSPAIDVWPVVDCLDAAGMALVFDLMGDLRPRDGDGVDGAACDAGAFEVPDAGVLSVARAGAGDGRIVSAPAGIDCPDACSSPFAGGTEVVLTAAAATDSVFAGWSGDCAGSDACAVQIDGDIAVTASFDVAPSHVLTLALDGDGHGAVTSTPSGIGCAPVCTASFASGSSVTLVAAAEFDSAFVGWSGGGCGGSGDCTLTLSTDTTVTASFDATAFLVDVAQVGTGAGTVLSDIAGIDCPETCSAMFDRTQTVALGATPSTGSAFLGWEGDCSGIGDCVLDMDLGPYVVDARFELLRTLSVVLSGSGSGAVTSAPAGIDCPGDCSESYANGTAVVLTAQAGLGSVFAGWSGTDISCPGTGPCTVAMTASRSVSAVFQTASYTLTATVDGGGQVVSDPAGIQCPADCSEVYLAGSVIELTATAAAGFVFDGWTGTCSGVGNCQVTVDSAKTVGARFVANTIEVFANGFE